MCARLGPNCKVVAVPGGVSSNHLTCDCLIPAAHTHTQTVLAMHVTPVTAAVVACRAVLCKIFRFES